MKVEQITKEDVEYFFNKYKNNSAQIFLLERKLLKESYDFSKWEEMLNENSALTRKLFVENEELLDKFIRPVIAEPQKLSNTALHTYALHTTFYLFENNIDSLVTDELMTALLSVPENLDSETKFELYMNLGISKTLTCQDSLQETLKCYDKAMEVFPTFNDAPDNNYRIHQIFCLTYKLLAYDLYKSNDYIGIKKTYDTLENFVHQGNEELYAKMWGENCDSKFHIELFLRIMRIYAIFAAGQNNFEIQQKSGQKSYKDEEEEIEQSQKIVNLIENWLTKEFETEKLEKSINPMIFAYYNKMRLKNGEISKDDYSDILFKKYQEISAQLNSLDSNEKISFIYPEMSFPDDNDPVPFQFSEILDKMKLFNWSFSYAFILLPEFYKSINDIIIKKQVSKDILSYFENAPYAVKGFQADNFIIQTVKTVADSLENVGNFITFLQKIFVHREIGSAIHFSMVSSFIGVCFSHMIERKPELFTTVDFPTKEDILKNRGKLVVFVKNAGMLHDLGKIGLTNLINLHFRRITDAEFGKIKIHPDLGADIAKEIPYLAIYEDLIRGHHKFYDGIGGYPANFDVKKSKFSVYINLLTICDSLDTATDYRGRNYAKKKNFDMVLEEFKKDSQSRYSKVLVDLINEDEALKDVLRYMTETGRKYTSYETYRKFILPTTEFSEADEKSVVLYTNEKFNSLKNFYKDSFKITDEENLKNHIEQLSDGKYSKIFILTDKKQKIFGILAGFVQIPLEKKETAFIITELFVHPEFRRHGYATELIKKVSQLLSSKGINHLKINVNNDFNLESFVWISGFTKTSTYLMDKQI